MSEIVVCYGCKKYDNTVIVDGKHYCKVCFDAAGLDYMMMDTVEHNRSNFEALGWDMDNADENELRKLQVKIRGKKN